MKNEKLLENVMLFVGCALMCAAVAFHFLAKLAISSRLLTLSPSGQETLHLISVGGALFLFVIGAGLVIAGWLYSGMNAWKTFMTVNTHREEKP
ncbi:TPA: hypothetical protein ACQ30S_004196 [Yersinia enterocolitica]